MYSLINMMNANKSFNSSSRDGNYEIPDYPKLSIAEGHEERTGHGLNKLIRVMNAVVDYRGFLLPSALVEAVDKRALLLFFFKSSLPFYCCILSPRAERKQKKNRQFLQLPLNHVFHTKQ